jgi:hypothetical protein
MVTVTQRKGKAIRRGICRAALELGVTRQHLYLVMRGERISPRISAWLRRHQKETPK